MARTTADKVLLPLGGKSLFRRSLEAFSAALPEVRFIVVTRDAEQEQHLRAEVAATGQTVSVEYTRGGVERGDSVRAGLALTTPGDGLVFIHDAARGLLAPQSIQLVAQAAGRDGAAVLAHPVTDTIKRIPDPHALERAVLEDLDRRLLWAMETPQVFRRDAIVAAYDHFDGAQTDDTAVFAAFGGRTTLVPNPHPNPKLTLPSDLPYFEALLAQSRLHD